MTYINNTIDKINNENILVVSFTGMTPHLEASLEISRRLSEKNNVSYIHLGKYVSRASLYSKNILKRKLQLPIRVQRAKNYLRKHNQEEAEIKLLDSKSIAKKMINLYKNEELKNLNNIDSIEDLKNIKHKTYCIGIGIASSLITMLKETDPFPLTESFQKELKEQYISSIKSIIFAEILLDEDSKYDSIVLLNGRLSVENAFKQVAQTKRTNIFFHESSFKNNRFFFENYMPHDFKMRKKEIIEVKNNLPKGIIEEVGKDFFERKAKGQEVWQESYTNKQMPSYSEELKNVIANCKLTKKKIISYFSISDDEYQAIDGAPPRYGEWKTQIHAIKSISNILKNLNYHLIVRVHPNLKNKGDLDKKKWNDLSKYIKTQGFSWISQDDLDSTYKLLEDSDLVISAGSTVGVEAIFKETPSVVIAECYYANAIECIQLCDSSEKIKSFIKDKNSFNKPNKAESYIFGAWQLKHAAKYKYFVATHKISTLYGHMEDGTRIASPGFSQNLINFTNQFMKFFS